jgi:hypothetical protein
MKMKQLFDCLHFFVLPRQLCQKRIIAMIALAAFTLAACTQKAPDEASTYNGQTPSATVEFKQIQVAYLGSGSTGTGMLTYQGQSYPFTISGLGIGGIGASSIAATGVVYNLTDLTQFPGAYAQGRYGFVVGTKSGGDLWLKNGNGVVMHLLAKRKGLMLSLGADAIVVTMTQPPTS